MERAASKARWFRAGFVVCVLAAASVTPPAFCQTGGARVSTRLAPRPAIGVNQAVRFVWNKGQAPANVLAQAHGTGFEASFERGGFVLGDLSHSGQHISLVGMSPRASIEPLDPQTGVVSFFYGKDPSRWVRGLTAYSRLRYKNIYPGIDMLFYDNQGKLEYDFVVAPGADPRSIRLRVDDGVPVHITEHGALQVGEGSEAVLHRPLLYQNVNDGKRVIEGKFVGLDEGTVGFQFASYDATRTLVIDPALTLLYGTYFGGIHNDVSNNVALDGQGNSYIVGASASQDYPVSGNAYQTDRKSIGVYKYAIVLTKVSPSGSVLFSTFLGGSSNDYIKNDTPNSSGLVLDAQGNAYFAGFTQSTDFPVTANAYQGTYPGGSQSAFVAGISSDGTQLLFSTYFGGPGSSQAGGIAAGPQSTLYVVGNAGAGLPTTTGAYLTTITGGQAAFVAVFKPANAGSAQLVASTYYGAASPEGNNSFTGNLGLGIAVDGSGNPWISGQTYTAQLPTTSNALQPTIPTINPSCQGGGAPLNSAAFFAKLSSDLTKLVYGSYWSGKNIGSNAGACSEFSGALALDGSGNVYLSGETASGTFPVTSGVPQGSYPGAGGFNAFVGFVSKFSPDGKQVLWSTYFGGNGGNTSMNALVLDSQANVWIGGQTSGGSNFPISQGAYISTLPGQTGGFLTELSNNGTTVLYSTYLGGSSQNSVTDLADSQGNVYATGNTSSTNFPLSSDAFQSQFANGDSGPDGNDIFFTILGAGLIGSFGPASGGNAGDTTITVSGSGIQQGAGCALEQGLTTIQAGLVSISSDGTSMTCTFALNGVSPGAYNLVVTNPGGASITGRQPFQVVQGTGPQIQTNVVGRSIVRIGVPSTFTLVATNVGNDDAYFTRVWVAIPSNLQLGFANPILDPFVEDNDTTTDYRFFITGIPDQDGYTYYGFVVPHLPAGASSSSQFQLTAANQESAFDVATYSQLPWFSQLSDVQTALNNLASNPAAISATCVVTPSQTLRDCSRPFVSDMAADVLNTLEH